MKQSILTIVELDNYPADVIARAAWLATLNGSELHLLLCDPTSSFISETFLVSTEVRQMADAVVTAEEQILEELAGPAKSQGLTVHTGVSRERPVSEAIIAKALDSNPLYVVKGTHYHSPAERATFAHTDWQLIRKLDYPLWFVKPGDWKDEPMIVAAVDPLHSHDKSAKLDTAIVDTAKSLADACDGHVELLHTYQRLEEIGKRAMTTFKPVKLPVDKLDETIRDEHRRRLDAFAADNSIDPDTIHQLPGRTHELLPTFARSHGANLVVMGALARSGLKRRIIGSTAERVLDHLPCDVLIVKSDPVNNG